MMYQLNPPINVITPKGNGRAIGWIDYGPDYHLLWICFIDETRECWTLENPYIRQSANFTFGRKKIDHEDLYSDQQQQIHDVFDSKYKEEK